MSWTRNHRDQVPCERPILLNDPLPALLGVAVVLAGDVLRRFLFPGLKTLPGRAGEW